MARIAGQAQATMATVVTTASQRKTPPAAGNSVTGTGNIIRPNARARMTLIGIDRGIATTQLAVDITSPSI